MMPMPTTKSSPSKRWMNALTEVVPEGPRRSYSQRPSGVMRLILREVLTLVAVGCAAGVAGMFVAGRSLSGFLFEVKPWDAATLGVVLAVVIAVAALACLIPGRRAAAEDPAGALRAD